MRTLGSEFMHLFAYRHTRNTAYELFAILQSISYNFIYLVSFNNMGHHKYIFTGVDTDDVCEKVSMCACCFWGADTFSLKLDAGHLQLWTWNLFRCGPKSDTCLICGHVKLMRMVRLEFVWLFFSLYACAERCCYPPAWCSVDLCYLVRYSDCLLGLKLRGN